MTPALESVDHIHVHVSDRRAAEAWYARVLGLRRVERLLFWADHGGPLTLENAAATVHLALFERPARTHHSTVAFGVSANEFLRWRTHLRDVLGSASLQDHAVSWSLYFTDPDGNPYEITCYDHAALGASLRDAGS